MKQLYLAIAIAWLVLPAAAQDVLIARGSTWRYLDDGSDRGTVWQDPAYNDGSWMIGDAEFGFGDGDEATVIDFGPDPLNKRITTYFRQEFTIPDPSVFVALEFRLRRDDGGVCYLNGEEVLRSNLADGSLDYMTHTGRPVERGSEEAFFPYYDRATGLVAGTNVIAVQVHLSGPDTHDASFDFELIGHRVPSVIRGPYVQMVSESAATIRFRTIVPTIGHVRYGDSPGALGQVVSDTVPTVDHEIRISGLTSNSRTFYSVGYPQGMLAGGDTDHWFQTAPPKGSRTPMRAWILGDCGTYDQRQRSVRDAYKAMTGDRRTDMMLMLGDNAYRIGDDQEYQLAIFETYNEMIRSTPMWSTRGNHELVPGSYFGAFSLPDQAQAGGLPSGVEDYYSFDWGNVHFVCLDSWASDKSPSSAMYRWCEADLQSTDQDWIIAFFHHPPYSDGSHTSDLEQNQIDMREIFVPLLEDHGVALIFSGHSHAYERSYLMDRHHQDSTTFNVTVHALDGGLGREVNGTGAYTRPPGPHGGAVYVVAGSSGHTTPAGALQHPAMVWNEREIGSVVLDVLGGRLDVTFIDGVGAPLDWFTVIDNTWDGGFCIGSVNGQGCVASLSITGTPSISSGQPFVVQANELRSNATSMLLYGLTPANSPLAGGRLCVGSPIYRTLPGSSQGTAPCTGTHTVDFAPLWNSPNHPALEAGARVHCQVWYRDTTPAGSALSEALAFTLEP